MMDQCSSVTLGFPCLTTMKTIMSSSLDNWQLVCCYAGGNNKENEIEQTYDNNKAISGSNGNNNEEALNSKNEKEHT